MREVPYKPTPQELRDAVNELVRGRSNATGSVTLATSGTTTTVTKDTISPKSEVLLFPKNSEAATELGAGTCYVSAVAVGSFTVTHASSAGTRTFGYAVIGG